MGLMEGPECLRCGANEQSCALAGGCCDDCTHTFDGTEIRLHICVDCGDEYILEQHSGPGRKRCDTCHEKAYPAPKKKYRLRHQEITSIEPARYADRYTWHVAPTGTAHLWGSAARLSHCGMVRGDEMKLSPVDATWPCLCKRCAAIIVNELERSA